MTIPTLIACDIDGTLMDYNQSSLSPELFPLIDRLIERGIRFCPASGRQYSSLLRLFDPVKEQLVCLCENGGILYDEKGRVLDKTVMDRKLAMALARNMLAMDDCEIIFSGENTTYAVLKGPGLDEQLRNFTGNHVAVIQSPEEMPEEILKLSAYCPRGAVNYFDRIRDKWGDIFQVAIGGPCWLDTALADKGVGIRALARALDIRLDEIMAFGDNYNDMPMLELVGMPYVVNRSTMKDIPDHFARCQRVEEVLEEILRHC